MKQVCLNRRQSFHRQMHTCLICQVLMLDRLLTATCCQTAAGEGQGGECSQKVGPEVCRTEGTYDVIPGVATCQEDPCSQPYCAEMQWSQEWAAHTAASTNGQGRCCTSALHL